jgi:putative peptidoglycan lipid II flippase
MKLRASISVRHGLLTAQIAANALIGYLFLKILATRFGASAEKDIFDIAYAIPFVILNVGGFAFAHGVMIAHFAKLSATRPEKVAPVFATTATCVVIGSVALAAGCAWFSGAISRIVAPGFSPNLQAELGHLILLLLPIVFSFSLCALFSAACVAYEAPVSNELGPLLSRVIVIAALWIGLVGNSLAQIASALAVCSVAGLAVQWILLRTTTDLRVRLAGAWSDSDFRSLARQVAGFLVVGCVAQVAMMYMRRLATFDHVGTNAALTYAISLLSPLGLVLGKPLLLVTGPRFASAFARNDRAEARAVFGRASLLCLVAGCASAAAITILAAPLIRLMFGGGHFDEQATTLTVGMLTYLVWSLPGSIVLWAVNMPLIAVSRSHLPAAIYIGGYLLQIVFMALLFPLLGRYALVWGYILASAFQALCGWYVVWRALSVSPHKVKQAVLPVNLATDRQAA